MNKTPLLLSFIILITITTFTTSDEINAKPRVRLRRPLKRTDLSNVTSSSSTVTATSTGGTRSRFRVKPHTTTTMRPEIDQVPEGSKSIISRVKPNVKQSLPKTTTDSNYKIVCYYTNWSQYRPKIGKFLPEDIDPGLCTHVIFAFGWMKKGKLSSFEATDESKDGKIGFYEKINNLKKINPKLKTLLAIGGWSFGTAKFKEMSATRYTRQIFVFSCIPYLRDRNFDGLDLDWEYPKGSDDKKNFVLLLKELRSAFESEAEETGKPRLLLSAAVPVGPDSIRGGYDVPEVNRHLDFINLMAYDFHGKWESQTGHNAPLYAPSSDSEWRKQLSVDNAAKTWVKLGASKEKLVIGMPTYGRSFILSDKRNYSVNVGTKGGGVAGVYTKESGFLAYYEICEILLSGSAIYIWDNEMKVPYLVSDDQWVGFDDERAIRNKMKWIKTEGYAGAMVWTVDMDDFRGDVCPGGNKYPLIGVMREELLGEKRPGPDVDWSSLVTTPEDIDNEPSQSLAAIKVDVKEVLANANKKKLNKLKPVLEAIEPKTRPPFILCSISSISSTRPGQAKFTISNVDPTLCTHIVYNSAKIKDNKLSPESESDTSTDGAYSKLLKLKELNPDLKILISLSSSDKVFEKLVGNVYRMNNFVYGAVEFLREFSFDGIDVNWDVASGTNKEAYLNFIRELRMAFEGEAKSTKEARILLTVTVPAREETIKQGYAVPELSELVDYFNLKTFDLHDKSDKTVGHNAPLHPIDSESATLTVSYAAGVWVKMGAPREKIVLGMPTYGRTFTLKDPEKFDIGAEVIGGGKEGEFTREKGFMAYYEVCSFLSSQNTTLVWDNEQSVPFAYNSNQWVGFDDERSFKAKIDFLKSESFGGVMIKSLDLDDFHNHCGTGKFPLVGSVLDELKDYKVVLEYNGPYEGSGNGGKSKNKDVNEVYCQEEDGHISYHPDKADCSKYYMCEGERKHHMPCPANLVFNPDQNVCDWAENVEGCNMVKDTAAGV